MPFTFLAHQAPVLPLKLLAPHRFDGTALVVGSMAPDLAYVLGGTPLEIDAHTWAAQLTVCLPLTLALTVLIKRFAVVALGPHLPDAGDFHFRDFARLARWRVTPGTLGVAAVSALVGSATHVVLDAFTHGDGWGVRLLPWLRTSVLVLPDGVPGRYVNAFDVLQLGGSLIGGVATTAMLLSIGRRRLLIQWYPSGPPVAVPTEGEAKRWRTGLAVAGAAVVLLMVATITVGDGKHLVVRVVTATIAGAVLAGAAAGTRTARDPTAA